ncbi:MAG: NAD(P)(+) transhydrogenase (Re/Si-specific) subunit beta [Clostridiaceae bacterium]|nr:NAD(P)(+) transhydrogenase (Re/Si-specific) subunit beta [Clostridiaceae bacterium]
MSDLIYYLICGALTIGVLAGIALMSRVRTAVPGNRLSAVCTVLAILVTLYRNGLLSDLGLWLCLAAGLGIGIVVTLRVKMIEMPQMVALLNGLGGAASALVAMIALTDGVPLDAFSSATAALALIVGLITLTGSLIAAGKLHKLIAQKPVVWPYHLFITSGSLAVSLLALLALTAGWLPAAGMIIIMAAASSFFGVAFAIRVGGADMPITISLLNSLSGVAGSIAGMAIGDPLLVAIGGIVGASGLLLTQIMCRAMNRSLLDIILGKTAGGPVREKAAEALPAASDAPAAAAAEPAGSDSPADPAELLRQARRVIIVPGYGMALAQAQDLVKRLADKLEKMGAVVQFAIHPVAGRMPGHMNVLLCEVDVPYESLHEMEEINPQFADCDVAIVIGANDVINPAANTATGTPIYGMPVLAVEKARQVIICNYDLKPGYAGVDNPLYTRNKGVTLLLGDAKQTLARLLADLE